MIKLPKNLFSLEILKKLNFTTAFYKAVEERLLSKGKFLELEIKPGEGCGGFTYEFKSLEGTPGKGKLVLEKGK